jgi:hypothetical protein
MGTSVKKICEAVVYTLLFSSVSLVTKSSEFHSSMQTPTDASIVVHGC